MSQQITVRLPDALAAALQDLVADGSFETKAEAIRAAIEALIDTERRRRVGDAIVEGYRRMPETHDELEEARRASIRSIEEEPW
ncbi:MAG: ribbon-helix-helix protein, CopG family [Actinomycetota bacterium]